MNGVLLAKMDQVFSLENQNYSKICFDPNPSEQMLLQAVTQSKVNKVAGSLDLWASLI